MKIEKFVNRLGIYEKYQSGEGKERRMSILKGTLIILPLII